ncbi:MAG: hypothetical protein IJS00_02710 [Paludibacteraceae bacterium]|nr:hypothetical protein [Paludibacteraceae bacterium]
MMVQTMSKRLLIIAAGLLLAVGIKAEAEIEAKAEIKAEVEEGVSQKKSLLPDYKKKVGFTYGVGADIVSNYIWRGLYVGGLGVQADVNVGYGGLFLDMWWNIGATDWTFKTQASNGRVKGFNPEVDMTIGFSRWGLTVMFMHMYYFDRYKNFDGSLGGNSRYFDFSNAAPGGGITQEWRIKYRVSDALPISILWCTRTWGRDGYMVNGDDTQISIDEYNAMSDPDSIAAVHTVRAYSSYLELGYDIALPRNLVLEARVGMTPWKSMYTGYTADFAVCNVSAKLNWHKEISEHCLMTAFANLMLNPYDIATGCKINSGRQFLWNIGCGFYLK